MTKILVIDLETTGFSSRADKIVEIGIVELDLLNGETEIVFDQLIKEDSLTLPEFTKSWVFENTDITVEDITSAKNLQHYHQEIQNIISGNPLGLTAFNNGFDFRFLEARGFVIPKKLGDPMRISKDICRIPGKRSGYKVPNMEEAYNHFFPNENFKESHRAADDAKREAKIIYCLYKLGVF